MKFNVCVSKLWQLIANFKKMRIRRNATIYLSILLAGLHKSDKPREGCESHINLKHLMIRANVNSKSHDKILSICHVNILALAHHLLIPLDVYLFLESIQSKEQKWNKKRNVWCIASYCLNKEKKPLWEAFSTRKLLTLLFMFDCWKVEVRIQYKMQFCDPRRIRIRFLTFVSSRIYCAPFFCYKLTALTEEKNSFEHLIGWPIKYSSAESLESLTYMHSCPMKTKPNKWNESRTTNVHWKCN